MELGQCRCVWLQSWSVSVLFEWRLASTSLQHMLHVNVTRMCDPERPEAAKFPLILSFPCTLTYGAHPLPRLATSTVWDSSFSLPPASSPSLLPLTFLPHFFPSSLPLPFPSILPTFLLSSSSLPFRLQLGAVQTRMQSKGGYSNGSDVPDTVTPTGTFVVRTRKQWAVHTSDSACCGITARAHDDVIIICIRYK